jgi:hypothetical protein
LMTHFLNCIAAQRPSDDWNGSNSLVRFWLAIALGAILLPWLPYPVVGDASTALEFGNILGGLWPAAGGIGVAIALSLSGLSLPHVPVGDTVVLYERAFGRLLALGPWLERLDGRLRQWPVAGISFLLIVLSLLTATIVGN